GPRDGDDVGAGLRRAHFLAAEIVDALDLRVPIHQYPLPATEILDGEGNLLPPLAGHGHRGERDVDLLVLDRRDAVCGVDRYELVPAGIVITEDRIGDLPGDVRLESVDFPGKWVAEAEQEGTRTDSDDQPAAGVDVCHWAAPGHGAGCRQGTARPVALP